IREPIGRLPENDGETQWIIATGPLTHSDLAQDIARFCGEENLAFFDAIAPIIHADTIDYSIAWEQSRYDKGGGDDYLNCPLTKEQYQQFIADIIAAESKQFHDWESDTPYFESCLPIEVMAQRGSETLRFGPMKPVGLTNTHDPHTKPYAVVQLRKENNDATLWNMVGFQTKMSYGDQIRIFSTIPGLEKAEFARLGGVHRNMFVNAPKVLGDTLKLRGCNHIRLAGQITGVEGYVESAAIGMLAARFAVCDILGKIPSLPDRTCAFGALLGHLRNPLIRENFQPMNVNFGLFTPLEQTGKKPLKGLARKQEFCRRAKQNIAQWDLLGLSVLESA
ncbi:MAG: methylenetetrahydrofolate--tRNA-(uracil(54)-C(5))-methyltransferase (FADH(2)-oxidizing) TrmFO, partial [Pseudomonadota bacterium]